MGVVLEPSPKTLLFFTSDQAAAVVSTRWCTQQRLVAAVVWGMFFLSDSRHYFLHLWPFGVRCASPLALTSRDGAWTTYSPSTLATLTTALANHTIVCVISCDSCKRIVIPNFNTAEESFSRHFPVFCGLIRKLQTAQFVWDTKSYARKLRLHRAIHMSSKELFTQSWAPKSFAWAKELN